jgi:hypothetical protein
VFTCCLAVGAADVLAGRLGRLGAAGVPASVLAVGSADIRAGSFAIGEFDGLCGRCASTELCSYHNHR